MPLSYRRLKNVIHQIYIKSKWMLLSVTFRAKIVLVFALTLENVFSQSFYFKTNRKRIGSFKKQYQGFSKQPSIQPSKILYCNLHNFIFAVVLKIGCFRCVSLQYFRSSGKASNLNATLNTLLSFLIRTTVYKSITHTRKTCCI